VLKPAVLTAVGRRARRPGFLVGPPRPTVVNTIGWSTLKLGWYPLNLEDPRRPDAVVSNDRFHLGTFQNMSTLYALLGFDVRVHMLWLLPCIYAVTLLTWKIPGGPTLDGCLASSCGAWWTLPGIHNPKRVLTWKTPGGPTLRALDCSCLACFP
jgi:hypothetical protein